jgi:hypothetical protein
MVEKQWNITRCLKITMENDKYKSKLYIILGLLLFIIGICAAVLIFTFLNLNHWTTKKIVEKNIIPLPKAINSIKDGLPYANAKVKSINNGAYLTDIVIGFVGHQAIQDRKGVIGYGYFVKNKSILGYPDYYYRVDIDMKKQATVRFNAFGGKNLLGGNWLNVMKWNVDIDKLFDLIEIENYVKNIKNPKVVVNANDLIWSISIFDFADKRHNIDKEIKFNSKTNHIISVESRR